jgi:8-oxo-dGTP diphosphatase
VSKVTGVKDIAYVDRLAVRIVAKDARDQIMVIFVKKGNRYKLPRGCMEADEDHRVASEGKMIEETGCKVEIEGECMRTTEEWRNNLHQISYCYSGRIIDRTGTSKLAKDELVDGLQHDGRRLRARLRR